MFSPLTKQLIEALRALPGVGPKSAQRMTFELLAPTGRNKAQTLARALQQADSHIKHCEVCHHYTESTICPLCSDPKRDRSLICIVETCADLIAIEQTTIFRGLYHVLHGRLSPLDGIGPHEIRLPSLFERLRNESIREVIIATNPTMEGKATAHYIVSHIDSNKIKCTRIAHGVPLGGELEYLDAGTLSHAFMSRVLIEEQKSF